ncbi:MAG: aminotransferase class IV, partial [Candidatus Riflebacteria bacterium]|nr:aminotransferase class IV [Candidatus Riflebacteria bacterium]
MARPARRSADPLAYCGGRFVPAARARVPLLDRGFLFGDGVFETLRTYGRRPFRLGRHLERLRRSARGLAFEITETDEALARIIHEGIGRVDLPEVSVRLMVTRGVSQPSYLPPEPASPQVYGIFGPLPVFSPQPGQQGVKIVTWVEEKPERFSRVKIMNGVPAITARRVAVSRGAYEAVRTSPQGALIEGFISNIFVVSGGVLRTPPVEAGLLDGVTRGVIMEVARIWGLTVREEPIPVADLGATQEVFLTHTSVGVMPVVDADGVRIGDG